MKFIGHSPQRAALYRAQGKWRGWTLGDVLAHEFSLNPQRPLVTDGERVLTVAELDADARALAAWLSELGVGPGDVVSFQLPNWAEILVIDAAASFVGAISNPIVPIYRDAEVEFILRDSGSKVVFVPDVFRSMDYATMMRRLTPSLPDLRAVVSVRGAGGLSYDRIVDRSRVPWGPLRISPDDPRLVMYTSGTTGRAKGVLHSYNTLEAEIRTAAGTWRLNRGDVVLMPSPLTHITGYLYGMGFPTSIGMTAVLMDRWNAESALELIETHLVNCIVAATPFLKELADAARRSRRRLPSLRVFACGGAPVAPEIVRNAMEAFENCAVFRVYGSTEAPTVTLGSLTDREVAAATDGYVVGHDVKIVDEQGRTLPPGEEGEILTCGPEVMLGYKRLEDNEDVFDSEGYFRTGDLGVLRPDNALVITGRKKDLIIRGGENLSAKEIEDVLYENPAVQEVAIVATPHERLGEGVCAVIVPAEGHQLTLADIATFLSARGLARQKFPERLEVVDALPRTASGKIQKYVLREWLKQGSPLGGMPGST